PGPGAGSWTFAEGTVRPGFNEFVTLLNPNATSDTATIDYLVNGGPVVSRAVVLQPSSRTTVVVSGPAAQGGFASPFESDGADMGVRVKSASGGPIVAE